MASLAKAAQMSKKAQNQTTMFAAVKSPFLETLTAEDLGKIQAATEVVLDFETTCLSPFDVTPTPLTSSSKIGDKTAGQYIKATGAAFNSAPRARILSLGLPETGDFLIFDLDRLSEEEKQALLTASIHNKVLVGHNLQFDLMWANAICSGVKPARIVDTMLLLRSHLPQAETLLRKRLARDFYTAPRDREALTELITNADASSAKKDSGFGSLLAACLVVCLPAPDKSYQKPQNWMPDILSQKHFDYCKSDVFEPAIIARRLLTLAAVADGSDKHTTSGALRGQYDQIPTDGLLSLLDRLPGADAYRSSESAIPVLLELQKNGLRMDGEATEQYANQQIEKAAQIFEDELSKYPAMKALKEVILKDGETQQLKAAINAAVGGTLPRTEKDELSLSKKALTLCGLDQHPVISAYLKIKALRKRADMVRDYFSLVDAEQRLHPMVAINTKTLRTSSQNPNLQNVPRDGAVRSLYCAAPGNVMVAVDYSAIELRIAAALTVRAVREIRAMMDDKDGWGPMHWLRDAVTELLSKADTVELAQDPREYEDIDSVESSVSIDRWKAHYAGQFAARIQQVQQAGGLTLLKAFQHNVDPHLATALYLLSLRGEYDLQGKNPVDYLAGISAEEQSALKKQYKGDRQAAKACIAKGQLVLTDKGLVPIENVTTEHKLWDGIEWVKHDGVIYKGYKEVINYAGLTATPDHKCFVSDDESVCFGELAGGKGLILETAVGGNPVPIRAATGRGHLCYRKDSLRQYILPGMSANEAGKFGQSVSAQNGLYLHEEQKISRYSAVRGGNLGGALRRKNADVRPAKKGYVPELCRKRHTVALCESGALHSVGAGESATLGLQGGGFGPHKQQWALRAGKPSAGVSCGEFAEHAEKQVLQLQGEAVNCCGPVGGTQSGLPGVRTKQELDFSVGGKRGNSTGHPFAEATQEKQYAHVYDIVNAGPRHRFTVQGLLVANCNFGLLYKMGPESLHKYGITGYGLDWTEEDAEAAYHAWHNLYPEIGLWQLYTQLHGLYVDPSGAKRHDLAVGHHTERRLELADNRKVYQSFTLSGRPIISRNLTEAMNFQDQGTGAEIALEALACLPRYLRPHVVLFVHDEIVLEVPKDKAPAYQRDLERIMVAAAEALLEPFGVPVEVEGAVSEHWQH